MSAAALLGLWTDAMFPKLAKGSQKCNEKCRLWTPAQTHRLRTAGEARGMCFTCTPDEPPNKASLGDTAQPFTAPNCWEEGARTVKPSGTRVGHTFPVSVSITHLDGTADGKGSE